MKKKTVKKVLTATLTISMVVAMVPCDTMACENACNKKQTIENMEDLSLFLGFDKQEIEYSLNIKNNNKEVCTNLIEKKQNYEGDIPVFTYSLEEDLHGSIQIDEKGKVTITNRVMLLDQMGKTGKSVQVKAENKDLGLSYLYTIHFKPNDAADHLFMIKKNDVILKKPKEYNLVTDSQLNDSDEKTGSKSISKKGLRQFYVIDKNGNVNGPFVLKNLENEFQIESIEFGNCEQLTLITSNQNQTNNYIFNKKKLVPLKIQVKSENELTKIRILDTATNEEFILMPCDWKNTKETKDGYEVVLDANKLHEMSGLVTVEAEDFFENITTKDVNLIYDITSPKVSVKIVSPASQERFGQIIEDTFYAFETVEAHIEIEEKNLFKEDQIIDGAQTTWISVNPKIYKHKLQSELMSDGNYALIYKEDHSGNKAKYTSIQYIDVDTQKENVVSIKNIENKNKFIIKVKDRNFNPTSFILFNDTVELTQLNNLLHNLENWKEKDEEYTFTYDNQQYKMNDGEYKLNWKYTKKNGMNLKSQNPVVVLIDNTAPTVTIVEEGVGPVSIIDGHPYYNQSKVYKVRVEDVNFKNKTSVIEVSLDNNLYKESDWAFVNGGYEKTFTFDHDANVSLHVKEVKDDFENKAVKINPVSFTVDQSAPAELNIQYLDENGNEIKQKDKFFQYAVRARISATDSISPITYFEFGYKNIPGASEINQELKENIRSELKNIQEKDGKYYIEFDLPQVQNAQVNAKVNYATKDAAGNETRVEERLGDHVIVDTIDPVLNVTLSNPVQTMGGISYYAGNITAAVRVDEANFVEENVVVLVNGVPHAVSKWTHDKDTHTATVVISGDGDYTLEVSCKDQVGRKSIPFKSNQLTIDTQITEPVLTINGANGNGQSYRGHVAAGISMEDKNFESYEAHLTRTRYNQHGVDVTSEFIHGISTDIHGGSGVFDTFKNIKENDGIYTLTVTMKDRAGHSATSTMTFTINRYGSVYVYDEYLSSLIQKNKNFFKEIKHDLVIDEYNPDRLVDGSMKVTVLKDGKPMKNVKYDVQSLNNGWNQYRYVISKNNFKSDGVYKIIVSSTDTSGNNPENSSVEGKEIMFFVDNTAPEISSVAGLEDKIINANKLNVKFNVFDTIGIKKIQVFVNGKEVMKVEGQQLKEDMSNYFGKFVLKESSSKQNVRIVVTDMAGNVTDTSSADFTSAYEFNSDVLVSTNFLARFFANKLLFFGLLIVFVGLFLLKKYPKIY